MQHKTKTVFLVHCAAAADVTTLHIPNFCFHARVPAAHVYRLVLYCSSFLFERRFSLLFVWFFRIVSQQRRWIYIKYSAVFQFRLLSAAKLLHLLKGTVLYILLFAVSPSLSPTSLSISILLCGYLNEKKKSSKKWKIIMTCTEFQAAETVAATFVLWKKITVQYMDPQPE